MVIQGITKCEVQLMQYSDLILLPLGAPSSLAIFRRSLTLAVHLFDPHLVKQTLLYLSFTIVPDDSQKVR